MVDSTTIPRNMATMGAKATEKDARLRKPATAAVRGATLAPRKTAGLAEAVDREAARLLRTSEGLARAALALLETKAAVAPSRRRAPTPGAETLRPKAGGSVATSGKDAVQPGKPTPSPTGTTPTKRKRKRKKNNKRKEKTKEDSGSKGRTGKDRP